MHGGLKVALGFWEMQLRCARRLKTMDLGCQASVGKRRESVGV